MIDIFFQNDFSPEQLKKNINQQGFICPTLHVFETIDSTNTYLLNNLDLPSGTICMAKSQRSGRGQQGRHWVSPKGGNLYASILWKTDPGKALNSLPLWVSIALVDALNRLGFQGIQLKWPNDIVFDGQKLAGVLIESVMKRHSISLIIGIGLNVMMPSQTKSISQPWCDLSQVQFVGQRQDFLALLTTLFQHIFSLMNQYPYISGLTDCWAKYDVFKDKTIPFKHQGKRRLGSAQGVDEFGRYLIDQDSRLYTLCTGDDCILWP